MPRSAIRLCRGIRKRSQTVLSYFEMRIEELTLKNKVWMIDQIDSASSNVLEAELGPGGARSKMQQSYIGECC